MKVREDRHIDDVVFVVSYELKGIVTPILVFLSREEANSYMLILAKKNSDGRFMVVKYGGGEVVDKCSYLGVKEGTYHV